ncbi:MULTISPECIES: hypothetical protein [unclassified Streptomyces]|uniref:hypothetical protein n=1 Tax=unclassified Streptomyces TaxID=2593676 RepID=UPI002E317473|nr:MULTISPECIES: hypothetical protein [unclassified Streptomyces]
MLTQLNPTVVPLASLAEGAAVASLISEGETPLSDAPLFTPASATSFLILLGPKEPKEK